MAKWLKADLERTKADWVIAFWHHPPYTKGSHDSDDILDSNGRTVLSAGLTLGLVILPVIIINAQEAIRAVPSSFREAEYS